MSPLISRGHDDTEHQLVVYELFIRPNEPRYVGQTRRGVVRRLQEHLGSALVDKPILPVHCWIKSVGPKNVKIDILQVCQTFEELDEAEIFWIRTLRLAVDKRLLNVLDGGQGLHGFRHTDESKRKISEATKGVPKSAETRQRMSTARKGAGATWYGKTFTDEHRSRISAAIAGEHNPFYGKRHSDETKKKISKSKKGKPSLPNHLRWHIKRGMTSDICLFCIEDKNSVMS